MSKRSAPHVQIPPTDWLKFNRLAEAQSASHFPGPSVLTFRQQPAHQGQIPRMKPQRSVLFCRCAFARVVPDDVKNDVLKHLVHSAEPFDAVGDLCEMSARKDPTLIDLAAQGNLTVVACYPRAVKWLFSAAGAPLPSEGVEVLNMRTEDAPTICQRLASGLCNSPTDTSSLSSESATAESSLSGGSA